MSLFYFFGGDGTDRAGLGGGCMPRRWRSQPQHTRNGCTRQAARQTVPDARQTAHNKPRTGTHAQTLDTLRREIGTAAGTNGTVLVCCVCNIFMHLYV